MSFDISISLEARTRTERGKNATRRLRGAGEIPVTLYGGADAAASGAVNRRALAALLRTHGRNKIFTFNLDGAATTVKIAEMQLDPIKGNVLHLDLMRISLTEKTEFQVPIKIVGVAEGVKAGGGILEVVRHSLAIRCLPPDLPAAIEVDVTALGLGAHIDVADLQLDRDKLEVLTDAAAVIATVVALRAEEPVAVAAEVVAGTEPEVIKKGKTEA